MSDEDYWTMAIDGSKIATNSGTVSSQLLAYYKAQKDLPVLRLSCSNDSPIPMDLLLLVEEDV